MANKIDFSIATSGQIEGFLCGQLRKTRLARNITQAQLAHASGLAIKTVKRAEQGQGVSLDTFIRIMMALDLQPSLETLLPDPSVRPMERVSLGGRERRRARPVQPESGNSPWSWGDEPGGKK